MTAIICQLAQLLADSPAKFEGKWEIPAPHEGWETTVGVSIKLAEEMLHVSISAYGHRTNDSEGRHRGHVYYPAFFGTAPRQSIRPEWMNGVLAREVETAIMAARSFRDEDLSEEMLSDQYKEAAFYDGMAGYFESTLDHCGK